MITLQTDINNDLFKDNNNNLALATDLTAVQNVCQNNCLTLQGEIPLDVLSGIPYFDVILGAHPNLELFRQYITQAIAKVEHVLSVDNFQMDFEDGTLKYSVLIQTDYGETILNG